MASICFYYVGKSRHVFCPYVLILNILRFNNNLSIFATASDEVEMKTSGRSQRLIINFIDYVKYNHHILRARSSEHEHRKDPGQQRS